MKKINKAGLAFLALGLFLVASQASAIEYGGLGGRPAYPQADNSRTQSIFVHTLNPGEVKKDGVYVINNTSEKKTVFIYSTDSTPSTGGAFACKQMGDSKTDVGAWVALEKSEVILEANSKVLVPFAIKVPGNASVGEHNGCILFQEKKAAAGQEAGVNLSVRTGLRMVITIPGELIRKLEILGFKVERQAKLLILKPQVKNTGNVSIDTDVSVVTRYFFGKKYATSGGQFPILRGETSDWNFELKKPVWGGLYYSQLVVKYDEHASSVVGKDSGEGLSSLKSANHFLLVCPKWWAGLIELVILLLIIYGCRLICQARKVKKQINKTWITYHIKEGDDIQNLAKELGVKWSLLAKVNKLSAPYILRPGHEIKVPPKK